MDEKRKVENQGKKRKRERERGRESWGRKEREKETQKSLKQEQGAWLMSLSNHGSSWGSCDRNRPKYMRTKIQNRST